MNKGIIYIIKNTMNDKVYVGQTIQSLKLRWRQHIKDAKSNKTNQLIHKAINKYGETNFVCEILEDNIPIHLLNEKEEFYIKQYNSFENGYNLCPGGNQWRRKPLEIDNSDIINLYKKGISSREIATQYGISHSTVLQRLENNNIERRIKENNLPDKTVNIEDIEEKLKKLYLQEELPKRQIARILNVDEKTIRRWLKKYNIGV